MMETEALAPQKTAGRRVARVSQPDLGLQEQLPRPLQAKVVQAKGCSRGDVYSFPCLLISTFLSYYSKP